MSAFLVVFAALTTPYTLFDQVIWLDTASNIPVFPTVPERHALHSFAGQFASDVVTWSSSHILVLGGDGSVCQAFHDSMLLGLT